MLLRYYFDLYRLIQPSFSTLVELEIFPRFPHYVRHRRPFDLRPLRPVGKTLQKFVYKMLDFDPGALDAIPDVFPHLITLELMVGTSERAFQWKVPIPIEFGSRSESDSALQKSYNKALSRNTRMQSLAVFARFVFCEAYNHIPGPCSLCAKEAAKTTDALAMLHIGLQRCVWATWDTRYAFTINSADGSNTRPMEMTTQPVSIRCMDLDFGLT
jgi:hypothetical protein